MKKIKAAILSAGLMLFISVLLLAILSFIFAKTSSLPKASLTVLTTVAASIAVFWVVFFPPFICGKKEFSLES